MLLNLQEAMNGIISIHFTIMSSGRAYGTFMGTNEIGYKLAAPSRLFME